MYTTIKNHICQGFPYWGNEEILPHRPKIDHFRVGVWISSHPPSRPLSLTLIGKPWLLNAINSIKEPFKNENISAILKGKIHAKQFPRNNTKFTRNNFWQYTLKYQSNYNFAKKVSNSNF